MLGERHPDELLRRQADELGVGRVDPDEPRAQVSQGQADRARVEEVLEDVVAGRQHGHGAAPGGPRGTVCSLAATPGACPHPGRACLPSAAGDHRRTAHVEGAAGQLEQGQRHLRLERGLFRAPPDDLAPAGQHQRDAGGARPGRSAAGRAGSAAAPPAPVGRPAWWRPGGRVAAPAAGRCRGRGPSPARTAPRAASTSVTPDLSTSPATAVRSTTRMRSVLGQPRLTSTTPGAGPRPDVRRHRCRPAPAGCPAPRRPLRAPGRR